MNQQLMEELQQAFLEHFGDREGAAFYFSPSRINIIGEHIDYNGGKVFPCALTIGTYGLARKNELGKLRLLSLNLSHYGELDFPLPTSYQKENDWMNYACGVSLYLEKEGWKTGGFDLAVAGDIPNGSGLSSSASLELLLGQVINELYNGGKIPRLSLVHAGVSAENDYLGLNTGVMDQYAIGFGRTGYAMVLDTAREEHDYVPFRMPGAKIVILNTNKRRELKDSKYNERRAECERALQELQAFRPGLDYLCQLSVDDLSLLEKIGEETVRRRARHVVTENSRVYRAVDAMKAGDMRKLGQLLRESQDSLRVDYEVTGPQLDAICEAANRQPGCYGARMTGAGFAGCGIALVEEGSLDDFIEKVGKEYKERTGLTAQFIISEAGDGTRKLAEP